ncbi:MAG: hypothetical protein U9R25_20175 [Chloroflexota bacterium]|nr:hypothetical protein [Chloroflexota bacterium]
MNTGDQRVEPGNRIDRWITCVISANPPRWAVGAVLLALIAFVMIQAAMAWRHFPGFVGDHGWYLQVANRVSQGEILYRDVAWAYGPLPAQTLAAMFAFFSADAAWASLVNLLLTCLSVLLTYGVLRCLLPAGISLVFTLFALLAGPYVWGNLFHTHYYVYTQAVAWGSVASLSTLLAALQWQQTKTQSWLIVAGVLSGFAILSKPEFGLTAVAASVAVMVAARASIGAWIRFLLGAGFSAIVGFGGQANLAGWQAVWRGYSGYDQLRQRALWGTRSGDILRSLGFYSLWAAVLALWMAKRHPRRRVVAVVAMIVAILAALVLFWPDLAGVGRRALLSGIGTGEWESVDPRPENLLLLVVATPWALLFWILLWAGWRGYSHNAPPVWWGLWAFSLLSNLRLVFTGFASGFAAAPALGVLWWLLVDANEDQDRALRLGRSALIGLGILLTVNLVAQLIVPNPFFNGARARLETELGAIVTAQTYAREAEIVQTKLRTDLSKSSSLFSLGWGADWYLLSGSSNQTQFDLVLAGLGTTEPESVRLQESLVDNPPQAVVVPSGWLNYNSPGNRDAQSFQEGLPVFWQTLNRDYVDQTPEGVSSWVLKVMPK